MSVDLEKAVNVILEYSGRAPFSKIELGTALPLLTHAVNADLKAKLESSEAALRTLREAARNWLYVDRLWSKNVDEFGGIKQADDELNKRRNALAAALAAEGGK